MKIGDLAYAKEDLGEWTQRNPWMKIDPTCLGIIIEVKDLMVAVLNNGKINWYGKPGVVVNIN